MTSPGEFRDYDDENVYIQSQELALDPSTRNFIVDFGKDSAQIAFNSSPEDVKRLMGERNSEERPIRWINIWAPNRQVAVTEVIGNYYKFSPRLLGMMCTAPPKAATTEEVRPEKMRDRLMNKFMRTDDVERGIRTSLTTNARVPTIPTSPASSTQYSEKTEKAENPSDPSHYMIAGQMINYSSTDITNRFLCIGANWMHDLPSRGPKEEYSFGTAHQRLWSWLILCDDSTVISLHEDPGPMSNGALSKAIRGNTLNVLSQLSLRADAAKKADPITLTSVRKALDWDLLQDNAGTEASSNLFYYLFDDWQTAYALINTYHTKLADLESAVLGDVDKKVHKTPGLEIIPTLHVIGRQLRAMQHLYEGYKQIIERVLELDDRVVQTSTVTSDNTSDMFPSKKHLDLILEPNGTIKGSFTADSIVTQRGVAISRSARKRFERLKDRIQLIVLSNIEEFNTEKDALVNTYFNINAQKDSEATAKLTSAGTLLAKLSVLFLPVSLMTSYFSIQIPETKHYTATTYWSTFAVIMSLSFVVVFFLGRWLIGATETLERRVKFLFGQGPLAKRMREEKEAKKRLEEANDG